MMAVDRTTDEYKQKVSDAEQRIESRLAELNRSIAEDNNIAQPASRIPVKEPTSPSIGGDRDVISSTAKLQKDVEKSHLPGEKLYIRTKNFQNWFGKWEKNEQLSSKIAVKTAFYNLYRILVQLWLKAKKTPCRQGPAGHYVYSDALLVLISQSEK